MPQCNTSSDAGLEARQIGMGRRRWRPGGRGLASCCRLTHALERQPAGVSADPCVHIRHRSACPRKRHSDVRARDAACRCMPCDCITVAGAAMPTWSLRPWTGATPSVRDASIGIGESWDLLAHPTLPAGGSLPHRNPRRKTVQHRDESAFRISRAVGMREAPVPCLPQPASRQCRGKHSAQADDRGAEIDVLGQKLAGLVPPPTRELQRDLGIDPH